MVLNANQLKFFNCFEKCANNYNNNNICYMKIFKAVTGQNLVTPGGNLKGKDQEDFINYKKLIDRCTNFHLNSDMLANFECMDLLNYEDRRPV
jgi:hypothetical protein